MYKVGRHYVGNYFYCRYQPEGYEAERDLLAIAKFCFLFHNGLAELAHNA